MKINHKNNKINDTDSKEINFNSNFKSEQKYLYVNICLKLKIMLANQYRRSLAGSEGTSNLIIYRTH